MLSSTNPTSPRLPSPPPPVEDLSNPTSPTFAPSPALAPKPATPNQTQIRRIRKGTKAKDISAPPLVPLSDLDSAFQLQEHLASIIAATTNPPSSDHSVPLAKEDCERIATPPEGVDEWLWCYELTRRLTRDLNSLIVGLLADNCTSETCPEMRASSWQYLCAVHETPRSCCAMDYSTHTLDHSATTLCSAKHFPSRLSLNTNGMKQLSSIFRRLYRIFAHAWFMHKSVFWDVENEYGLYVFFKTVSEKYDLIPEDNLTIPSTADGGYDGTNPGDDAFNRGKGSRFRDSDDEEVENDGFDDEGRPIIEGKSFLGNHRGSVIALQGSTMDADGELMPPQTGLSLGGSKQDFPLFSFQDSEISSSSTTEQEKEEQRAKKPPEGLSEGEVNVEGEPDYKLEQEDGNKF